MMHRFSGCLEEVSDPQLGSSGVREGDWKGGLGSYWRRTSRGQHFHAPKQWLLNGDVGGKVWQSEMAM